MNQLQLNEFQEHLLRSKKIVALVGAGLSVSSGLSTFRGNSSTALWKNFNMIDLATPDSFYIDPGLVWQFYSYRRYQALKAVPNNGHMSLAKLSKLPNIQYMTITQNVDGLNIRSGHDRKNLMEIHGSLFKLKCTNFTCNYVDSNNYEHPLTEELNDTEVECEMNPTNTSPKFLPVKSIDEKDLPRCPICQGLLRPGVVWFGESLSVKLMNQIDNFIELDHKVDLILVIGTSGTVYPANSYVDRVLLKNGKVAVFNTEIDDDILQGKVKNVWGFKGDAAEVLPKALDPLLNE